MGLTLSRDSCHALVHLPASELSWMALISQGFPLGQDRLEGRLRRH